MEKSIITTAATVLLLSSGSLAFAAATDATIAGQSPVMVSSGHAGGGHESVEALKAEVASLQGKLDSTETGRAYLLERLQEALDESKSVQAENSEMADTNTDLLKSLRFMTDSRDYLLDELDSSKMMHSESTSAASADNDAQEIALQRATKGREFLSAQSKRYRNKLITERKENSRNSLALERALRGRAYLSEKVDMLEQTANDNDKANARQSLALERALRGRAYLSEKVDMLEKAASDNEKANARQSLALERALRGRAYLSEKVDMLEQAASDNEKANARQSLALERALRGRAYLSEKVDSLETELEQITEVSFAQINSAIAERDAAKAVSNSTEWADTLSAELAESFSNLQGTEVTSLGDNSVAIKVGNTGLFSPGGFALSGAGKDLLGQIGTTIAQRGDSNIKIVGHTDNIPTGSASRFASNNELSLARATSALTYMTSIGVPADRLSVSGVGDTYPIASNDTEDGRLANRRVEIVLTEAK